MAPTMSRAIRIAGTGRLVVAACVWLLLVLPSPALQAAPRAELWSRWQANDPADGRHIDHSPWSDFLKNYVVAPHPSGIHRVRYKDVTADDRRTLQSYLRTLQGVSISNYSPAEQRPYWINLYNAATVELILSRYPVASIRDINISPGLFSRGPWGAKLWSVENEKVSLDDIEHRILRPIWNDNRVHYALNCASLGCPNLQPRAFTRDALEAMLEQGARDFINHPRGVAIRNGKLRVSSIYVWFQPDFGGNAEGLMEHWRQYAGPGLAAALSRYSGGLEHDYDWRLNGASEP
jgi:hypothetical protein